MPDLTKKTAAQLLQEKKAAVGKGAAAPAGEGPKPDEMMAAMQTAITSLAATMQGMQKNMQDMSAAFQSQLSTLSAAHSTPAKEEDPEVDLTNLDQMTRPQFMNTILQVVDRAVKGSVLKPINERLNNIEGSVTRTGLKTDIQEMKISKKDFLEWSKEMTQEISRNPELSMEDAYILARSRNPDKAKELDTKYNPPTPPESEEKPKPSIFGGFRPVNSGSEDAATDMAPREAAEKAFDDLMEDLGEDGKNMFMGTA